MVHIVNLGVVHSLAPTRDVLYAFAQLYSRYDQKSCVSYCPRFLGSLASLPKVMYFYNSKTTTDLIKQYRLGTITSAAFFESLLEYFPFLKEYSEDDYDNLGTTYRLQRERLTSLGKNTSSISALTQEMMGKALLEENWNRQIVFQEDDRRRFEHLLALGEPIVFIANTNSAHAQAIFGHLKEKHPRLAWREDLDFSGFSSDYELGTSGIRLNTDEPGIFFYPSFLAHTFKTAEQNKDHQSSLIGDLINKLQEDGNESKLTLVSNCEPDLAEAKRHGVLATSSDDFFREALMYQHGYSVTV